MPGRADRRTFVPPFPKLTIRPYACQRVMIDGIYIYTSPKEAVWADGIDPDGCKDVSISNSTIETGDDAIVFYSTDAFGPACPARTSRSRIAVFPPRLPP